jgi:hypothetical protein
MPIVAVLVISGERVDIHLVTDFPDQASGFTEVCRIAIFTRRVQGLFIKPANIMSIFLRYLW